MFRLNEIYNKHCFTHINFAFPVSWSFGKATKDVLAASELVTMTGKNGEKVQPVACPCFVFADYESTVKIMRIWNNQFDEYMQTAYRATVLFTVLVLYSYGRFPAHGGWNKGHNIGRTPIGKIPRWTHALLSFGMFQTMFEHHGSLGVYLPSRKTDSGRTSSVPSRVCANSTRTKTQTRRLNFHSALTSITIFLALIPGHPPGHTCRWL